MDRGTWRATVYEVGRVGHDLAIKPPSLRPCTSLLVLLYLPPPFFFFLRVKFYLGQNEDCSLGGNISDSSERLLQSSSGGKSIYKVLVKGEFDAMKHSFYKRFLLVMRS